MDRECRSSEARYGMVLDASLITGIDPPPEVESALAAINTAHNMVSSDISLAQATADQRIEQSKRAAEIETLKAQAEVQPLISLASQLADLKAAGEGALHAYVRNVRFGLLAMHSRLCTGGETMMSLLVSIFVTFLACFVSLPCCFWVSAVARYLRRRGGRHCYVYVLFGKVVGHHR